MAQLDHAAKRLYAALDILEQAVESRTAGAGDTELRQALEVARDENAALQDAAVAVTARLDKTIARLKATLRS